MRIAPLLFSYNSEPTGTVLQEIFVDKQEKYSIIECIILRTTSSREHDGIQQTTKWKWNETLKAWA